MMLDDYSLDQPNIQVKQPEIPQVLICSRIHTVTGYPFRICN
jgi:hypothetical protein